MSYPCLIFWTLANLNFALVIWPFFWSLLVSRVAIFLIAVAAEWGYNGINPDSIANAGIYGVFVSQSNDVSVGVPIMTAVFGAAHPDWPVLLYIGMLTRVMVNPFGFYMMQWGQIKKAEERREKAAALGIHPNEVAQTPRTQADRDADAAAAAGPFGSDIPSDDDPDNLDLNLPQSQSALVGLIIKRVFVNPLVLSSVLGIIANWIFSGHLPGLVDKFFELLGRCYNASSLFVLGVAMHGQLDRLADRRQLKIPLWLFVGKCVILPVIARFIAVWMGLGKTSPDLVLFSFILGTFPPSISLPFFAYEYKGMRTTNDTSQQQQQRQQAASSATRARKRPRHVCELIPPPALSLPSLPSLPSRSLPSSALVLVPRAQSPCSTSSPPQWCSAQSWLLP